MRQPILIVLLGVSGSGKSSVARALSERCGLHYLDADDFHSTAGRSRMAGGIPLTEELREPWIRSISGRLREFSAMNRHCVLAFSGLRKRHREPLRHTGFATTFMFLTGDRAVIKDHLSHRRDHFMPPELLDSQIETLEEPNEENEDDVIRISVATSLEAVVNNTLAALRKQGLPL